jgi:autoinducer 2-degrading protein
MDYVVTVEFEVDPPQFATFLPLMHENARLSRESEPGCRQFDVCTDPARPHAVFLYERYGDRTAFEAHLASSHFLAFDAAVREMITAKSVRTLLRVDPE